jgi:hypothetical protein
LDNGGILGAKDSTFDANFKKGQKIINDGCYLLRLNKNITDIACSRLLGIMNYRRDVK